jgi:hypothetical protein
MSFKKNFLSQRATKIALFNISFLLSLYLLNCCTNILPAEKNLDMTDSFYLKGTSPVHTNLLDKSFLQNPPEAVQFAVIVENKKLEAFNVNVFITDSAAFVPVGNFSAYPLDRGDNYLFRINDPVKKFVSENNVKKDSQKNIYLQFVLSKDTEISNELRIGVKQFKWIEKLD